MILPIMNSSISKILINSSRQNIYDALSSHVVVTFSLFVFFFLALLSPVGAQPTPDANLDSYQYKFSPSMAVIVVILIAALFFMAFFAFYIRHCSDSHSVGNSIRNLAGRSRRGMRGLDPSVIETFPTLVYSAVKEHKVGKGALECAVCLNEFEDDETLRLLPKCDHVFHPECIDAWLGSHTTCPVCRANLSPDQSGESGNQLADSNTELDLESQNDTVPPTGEPQQHLQEEEEQPQAVEAQVLNRSRTRGRSRSSRIRRVFPRSNSTGHSLVQPGECTERFTLRLPVEIRKQIMNRKLNRATSMVVLPRESSSRRGGVNGGDGEGSSRGRSYRRLKSLEPRVKSERWVLSKTAPFFMRMLSMKSPSPKGTSSNAEERDGGQGGKASEPGRPPV